MGNLSLDVGKWYDCVIFGYTAKTGDPLARIRKGDNRVIRLVKNKNETSQPTFSVYDTVRVRITGYDSPTSFVSSDYQLISWVVNSKKKEVAKKGNVALAFYDPSVKLLLWIGKYFDNMPQQNRRLNPEKTGNINLGGETYFFGLKHLKTITGAIELLDRIDYRGDIREVRVPSRDSSAERPKSLFENISVINEGGLDSQILELILKRHLWSGRVCSERIFCGAVYLTQKQRNCGTLQATENWLGASDGLSHGGLFDDWWKLYRDRE